jgi:hypothetical protein
MVSPATTLARRLQRTDQCHQTTARRTALSLSSGRWRRSVGWPRCHGQYSREHREIIERAGHRVTNSANETIAPQLGRQIRRGTARRSFLHRK